VSEDFPASAVMVIRKRPKSAAHYPTVGWQLSCSLVTMIQITDAIALPDREVTQRFVRATGDRGQNANRDATAVELRLDIRKSSLPLDVRERLICLAGRHVTQAGVLMIVSRASNSRLLALLKRAARPPKTHRLPVVPAPIREDRLVSKHRRAAVKRSRHPASAG
jgi:ribosome-associated protein